MSKHIKLKPRQAEFVHSPVRYTGFVGGVGSGKTFSGILKGLEWSNQPHAPGRAAPRGACLAIHYRELDDVVLPEFFEIVEGTGILKKYIKSKRKAILNNGAEIIFRSLDNPNWMRGLQLSWFFIDEARLVSRKAWDVLIGRLRQPGYKHGGWIATTPNGYDWVYDLFDPDGTDHIPGRYEIYRSRTEDNKENLPAEYIEDLYANYSDAEGNLTDFGKQELLGEFVGLTEGAVYRWSQSLFQDLNYRPDLPVYSAWDFGIGDPGVLEFAQVEYVPRPVSKERTLWLPKVYFLDAIEEADLSAASWADIYKEWVDVNLPPGTKVKNFGDPAGLQRAHSSGTSVIDDLASAGVNVTAAPKRPPDYGVRILNNLMDSNRLVVDRNKAKRLGQAFASSRWPLDKDGHKTGNKPVHDWTSHYTTAATYLANSVLDFYPRRTDKPKEKPPPGSAGDIKERILSGKGLRRVTRPTQQIGA